jgi:cob(I)alamin adenosyltransferase
MTGRVQVYTGDGKGKTTAAAGLALRACSAGLRVFFCQFLKCGSSGEVKLLRDRCPGVTIACFGTARFVRGKPSLRQMAAARTGFHALKDALTGGRFDVVIADEINVACKVGALEVDELLDLMAMRPGNVELIFTGRCAHPRVMERADLVTEMREVKHYYRAGQRARRGIEL